MLQTFVFADLAGFSALTETHGDETGANLAERFVVLAHEALGADGRLVGTSGDAVFLVAPTPSQALDVARRLLHRVDAEPGFPRLRVGIHYGEAAQRGEQFYGNAVNVAARIAAHARGGQTLATQHVAAAARAMALPVRSLGPVALRNLREPLELFSLGLDLAAESNVIDPVCRMRVEPGEAVAHLALEGVTYWFCSRECLRLFVAQRP